MEKKQIVDSILESMRLEVTEFVKKESSIQSSVEYEEEVLRLSREFAQTLINKSMGKMPKSRNAKKKY